MKYRKKPVEIEAIQWNGKNLFDVVTFYEGMSPDLSSNIALEKWEEHENKIRENWDFSGVPIDIYIREK